jgi:hypothetical protein
VTAWRGLAIAVVLWALGLLAAAGPPPAPGAAAPARCADAGPLDATLFLLGDAGAPRPEGEPVLAALAAAGADAVARVGGARAAAVFLGDNAYPDGVPAEDGRERRQAEQRLGAQLDAVRRAGLRAWFVPGNHDWASGGDDGAARIRAQTALLAASGVAAAAPADGCPGPVTAALGDRLGLVLLDTAWWLHPGPRPRASDTACPTGSPEAVTAALAAALRAAAEDGRHAIVLAHHPLVSGGPHGAAFDWSDHLFPLRALHPALLLPLPIVGSSYPLARRLGVSAQDLPSKSYTKMRRLIEGALSAAPPLVYAAGHDHGLQLLRGESARWHLVSGAGSSRLVTFARPVDGTVFAAGRPGFARLDAYAGGAVAVAFVTTSPDAPPREPFSACLAEAEPP